MKNSTVKFVNCQSGALALASLLFACSAAVPDTARALVGTCLGVTGSCNTVALGQSNLITAVVTNCSPVGISNIIVSDNLYGTIGTIAGLAPGGSATRTKSVTNTCGSFPNLVSASGTDQFGGPTFASSPATCVVQCTPRICVTKEVAIRLPNGFCDTNWSHLSIRTNSPDCEECPSFCYRIRVTNCGEDTLNNVSVSDNRLDLINCNIRAPLFPGESDECFVVAEHCINTTNTVTASGEGATSGTHVSTNDTAAAVVVQPGNPCISVTKEVVAKLPNGFCGTNWSHLAIATNSPDCEECPSFCYRIRVTNCGGETLNNVSVSDSRISLINCNIRSPLFPGESDECFVLADHCNNTTNTVTASGEGACSRTRVSTNDTAAAVVVQPGNPCIRVTKEVVAKLPNGFCDTNWSHLASGKKSANCTQCPSFCYRIRVTNCGDESLKNVSLSDNRLSLINCNIRTSLFPGESDECFVLTEHCDNTTNTVTASGEGACSRIFVRTNDTAAVLVVGGGNPCIRVTKEVTAELPTGDCDTNNWSHLVTVDNGTNSPCPSFCYRARVTNCGDETLTNVTVVDDVFDLSSCGFATTLVPGEVSECILTGVQHCCNATNTVTASGAGSCSGVGTSADDTAAVVVEDHVAPEVFCVPGVNPSGKKIPVAGKNPASGQNPDGYYQLLARDNCDSNPDIYLADSGSSFIAGPFASGDIIKLTQSPGKTPSQDPAPDPIVAHVHLKGDGLLFAVDAGGNVSEPVLCLVPRPPK